MSWRALRTDLKTLLDTVTDLKSIHALPTTDYSGYPAATIIPSSLESDYESQSNNTRVYAFTVFVLYAVDDRGVDYAIDRVEESINKVLERLEQEEAYGANRIIGDSLDETSEILAVQPTDVTIYQPQDQSNLVVGEFSVRIQVTKDFSIDLSSVGTWGSSVTTWGSTTSNWGAV